MTEHNIRVFNTKTITVDRKVTAFSLGQIFKCYYIIYSYSGCFPSYILVYTPYQCTYTTYTVSRDCNRPPFAKLSHNFDSTELFKIRLLSVDGTVSHKVVLKMLEQLKNCNIWTCCSGIQLAKKNWKSGDTGTSIYNCL